MMPQIATHDDAGSSVSTLFPQLLQIHKERDVAFVWLNRPDRHNLIDRATCLALARLAGELELDPEVRFVVLSGKGRHFSGGCELSGPSRSGQQVDLETCEIDAVNVTAMLDAWSRISKPTIARVHGAALGSACGLIAACDIVVASTDASFSAAEVRVGQIPALIAPYLVAAIGIRQARRWLLTGERLYAARAQSLGLVHEVVAPEALDDAVNSLLAALSQGAGQAQTRVKSLLHELAHDQPGDGLRSDLVRMHLAQLTSDEGREGLSAFQEKRPAIWQRL